MNTALGTNETTVTIIVKTAGAISPSVQNNRRSFRKTTSSMNGNSMNVDADADAEVAKGRSVSLGYQRLPSTGRSYMLKSMVKPHLSALTA
jgi:hypothetical protein